MKSDVYGFGVVLLEIISGERVLDPNRPSGEHNLVDWAKPLLPDKRKLRKLMDPQLQGQYPLRSAFQTAELILKCLEQDPKKRPSMDAVIETLKQISTIKMKPKDTKAQHRADAGQPTKHRHQSYHHSHLNSKHASGNTTGPAAHQKMPGKYSY